MKTTVQATASRTKSVCHNFGCTFIDGQFAIESDYSEEKNLVRFVCAEEVSLQVAVAILRGMKPFRNEAGSIRNENATLLAAVAAYLSGSIDCDLIKYGDGVYNACHSVVQIAAGEAEAAEKFPQTTLDNAP